MATSDERPLRLQEAALHKLLTGSSAERLTLSDGKQVTYTPADAKALRRYIAELRSRLGAVGGYRPIRARF